MDTIIKPYGAEHREMPCGCRLRYTLTQQPNGKTRTDCFKNEYMFVSASNMTEIEARKGAEEFLRVGHELTIPIWRKA